MSFIAIVGAGPVGGALAHRLAARDRVRQVRLIDPDHRVAEGKALDILQSGPVEGFGTRVTAAPDIEAAAGACVVVIADPAAGDGSFDGEAGLALVRRIARLEQDAPLLFATAGARVLMTRAIAELHVPARRVIGSAPMAFESAARALTGLALNGSGADVQLLVVGIPPEAAVVAWEEASAFGQPVREMIPPHQLLTISAQLARLWPPGPQTLASAAARIAEAVGAGGRRRFTCFVALEQPPTRGTVVAMPVEVGAGGIVRVLEPKLSRQEQTLLENGAGRGTAAPGTGA